MARSDGRIEPGQPLAGAISARAWNRAQDAADIVLAATPSVNGSAGNAIDRPYTWAHVKNSTLFDVPRWGVLAIESVSPEPDDYADSESTKLFQQTPILSGTIPAANTRQFAICVEPLLAGAIGRAAISGVVQCKIEIDQLTDRFVICKSSVWELKSAAYGNAEIIWKQQSAGTGKWALIRFSSGSNLLRARFQGNWVKGGFLEVSDVGSPGIVYNAKNYIATIDATELSDCLIGQIHGEWQLVSWDWHRLPNFSGTAQQVLTHSAGGGLEWVNTTNCEA